MERGITEEEMIRRWGTPAEYLAEHESFMKRHDKAELRAHDIHTGALISVTYVFRPYQVAKEHRELMVALAEQQPTVEE